MPTLPAPDFTETAALIRAVRLALDSALVTGAPLVDAYGRRPPVAFPPGTVAGVKRFDMGFTDAVQAGLTEWGDGEDRAPFVLVGLDGGTTVRAGAGQAPVIQGLPLSVVVAFKSGGRAFHESDAEALDAATDAVLFVLRPRHFSAAAAGALALTHTAFQAGDVGSLGVSFRRMEYTVSRSL